MKKLSYFLIFTILVIHIEGCNNKEESDITLVFDSSQIKSKVAIETITSAPNTTWQYPTVEVMDKDFKAIVMFIEKKGFPVIQQGIQSDYQYTFIDSQGTRHALITIKRDKDNNPSVSGTVHQISVWAYKDYKKLGKREDNFFGWGIFESDSSVYKASLMSFDEKTSKKYFNDMEQGYMEFLSLVQKKK